MPKTPAKDSPEFYAKVAKDFIVNLSVFMEPNELRAADSRNRVAANFLGIELDRLDTCATHDYCDPNDAMQCAMIANDMKSGNELAWDVCWRVAKAAGFKGSKVTPALARRILKVVTATGG